MEKEIKIKKGSTKPSIKFRLFNMDTYLPIDLTGAQINFFMEGPEGGADIKKFEGEGDVVVSPLTGIGKYEWHAGDTDTPGLYRAEFEIILSDGTKIKVPEGEEYIKIVVENH
ncbi:MAG: hypothetical protein ACE5H1_10675 [Thermodesulfobacteriota bacterium]